MAGDIMVKRKKEESEQTTSEPHEEEHKSEFDVHDKSGTSKADFYAQLLKEVDSVIGTETDLIANTANLSSLIFHGLNQRTAAAKINWAGFYFMRPKADTRELVLGPFQGQIACIRIAIGRGVCGACVKNATTMVVSDVHKFPGHIACDSASNSEIVVPIMKNVGDKEICIGVLDIDSAALSTFDEEDQKGLEAIIKTLVESKTDFTSLTGPLK